MVLGSQGTEMLGDLMAKGVSMRLHASPFVGSPQLNAPMVHRKVKSLPQALEKSPPRHENHDVFFVKKKGIFKKRNIKNQDLLGVVCVKVDYQNANSFLSFPIGHFQIMIIHSRGL